MNQKAVIIQFESDDFYQNTLDLVLYNMGLDSSIKASNREESKGLIQQIETGKLQPDIALIDTYIENDNEDGKKVAERLRKISPKTKIIGYSIMPTAEWADYEIIKSNRDSSKTVVKILEEVLGIKFNYSEAEDPEYSHI